MTKYDMLSHVVAVVFLVVAVVGVVCITRGQSGYNDLGARPGKAANDRAGGGGEERG